MSERLLSPYRRAGKLLGLVRELSSFCEQHEQSDLAGGLSFDEVIEAERQLGEVARWMKQLGSPRAPKERAADHVPAMEESF
ncbi:hypothetical protein IQ16_01770 [Bradyrhizobium huanghuaihaiense]|uniref:Uncharacterized protein n=1 Tax=Bradyrhizobium huanghuaihaiense TaxID=990078 RepID=A0A562RX32_9BRAD|nr:hypothetical protein [Bradyrhizobium huanghuaihaiense]TWI73632.1 hypothetical protein IQ16_01770 [Bradyrhizobium huanghuaihaiense]